MYVHFYIRPLPQTNLLIGKGLFISSSRHTRTHNIFSNFPILLLSEKCIKYYFKQLIKKSLFIITGNCYSHYLSSKLKTFFGIVIRIITEKLLFLKDFVISGLRSLFLHVSGKSKKVYSFSLFNHIYFQ